MTTFVIYDAAGAGWYLPDAGGDVVAYFQLETHISDDVPTGNDSDHAGTAYYSLTYDPTFSNLPGDELTFSYFYPNNPDLSELDWFNFNVYYNGDLTMSITPDGIYTLIGEVKDNVFGPDIGTLNTDPQSLTFTELIAGNDTITGNMFADFVHASTGNDLVRGNGGNDTLYGDAGNDTLIGGAGRDILAGGANLDRFDFNATAESRPGAALRDVVSDFKRIQHDRIDLSTIDADTTKAGNQGFVFIGADSFAHYHATHPTAYGMVRFSGGILQANVNANLAADIEIQVKGMASMAPGDFFL